MCMSPKNVDSGWPVLGVDTIRSILLSEELGT